MSSCVGIDRVESYVSQISSTLLRVAKEKIPSKRFYKHLNPNWNKDLKDAQLKSKSMYKAWKSSGSPSDSSNLFRLTYKAAKSVFRAKLRHHRKENRENFFDNLDSNLSDPKKMFAQIRNFMGKAQSITNSLLVDGVNYAGSDIPDAWAT